MKRILSAILLATFGFLVGCNDDDTEPDYPIEPYIESADLKFIEGSIYTNADTLNLSFYFRDGDMDLGLNYEASLDSPYHAFNFFLQDEGQLVKITTNNKSIDLDGDLYPVDIPLINVNDIKGKLATVRTREIAGFETLPEFIPPYNCTTYTYSQLLVNEKDKSVFDESYNLDRVLTSPTKSLYLLVDTFYYEINENHYNITVDYLVKQPDDSFVKFDFQKEFCTRGFNGIFSPMTGIKKGKKIVDGPFKIKGYSSKDGEFRYSLTSIGFKYLFGGKIIKLRVQIKDRALHNSNTIESNEIQIPI